MNTNPSAEPAQLRCRGTGAADADVDAETDVT